MLGSNITFYHNQKWNLLQTTSSFDQKLVNIAQMRLCKNATVYGPNLKYVSLTWLLVEEAMGRTFLILWEYQTQAVGVSGYFGKIKPLPPTWSKPFSFIWSVRFYEPLENFFKCSSPEEIFDYMRKKEIERDDLMLCNGDDDDELMMVVVVVLLMM